ncbi:MAG: class I SAM-dependent methyltransferase [Chloroflexi bacterium]|nr:class I SAM-dependent methyltransferase [Chloroflexota bacterium]
MSIDRSRRITFEETADLYNEVRPEYPNELAEDIIHLSALAPDASILEVGCGAGNATIAFAKRGYRLLGIELGEKLTEYARQRCKEFPNTVILQSAFEQWELTPYTFDLAFSADAFHWIQPEIGYPKLIHALNPGGSIALFWHIEPNLQTNWSGALDEIFGKHAPQEQGLRQGIKLEWLENIIRGNLREYCGIEDMTVRTYNWTETYNAEKFLKLLHTYSSLRALDDKTRVALHTEVRNVINQFDGSVENPYQAVLFHANVT